MKKTLYFAVLAIVLAGCSKESEIIDSVKDTKNTTVTLTANVESTKTSLSSGALHWIEGETISVGTAAGYIDFECVDAENGSFTHTFEGDVPELSLAVSPAQSGIFTSSDSYQVKLPASYTWAEGVTNALMVGVQDGTSYAFKHAAALLKVTYQNVPSGVKSFVLTTNENNSISEGAISLTGTAVESIEITNENESLDSKSITVNFETAPAAGSTIDIYVPVPTGTYSNLNVCLKNESGDVIGASGKTLTKNVVLTRASVRALPPIQLISSESTTIGATDNTSGFNVAHSQDFIIEKGKRLHLVFNNYTADFSADWRSWQNWVLMVSDSPRETDGRTEYIAYRADGYGWDDYYNSGVDQTLRFSNPDWLPDASLFRDEMNGSKVDMTIDFGSDGLIYIYAKITATNGAVYTRKFHTTVQIDKSSISVYLTCENSHLVLENAYFDNSRGDRNAQSISLSKLPATIPVGYSTWSLYKQSIANGGDELSAEVTYSDGSTGYVNLYDLTIGSLSEIGSGKTLTCSYGKTKFGSDCGSVSVDSTVEVEANYVIGIEAAVNAVVYGASDLVSLSDESFEVTATWANYTTSKLSSVEYSIDNWNGSYWGTTYTAQNRTAIATVHHTNTKSTELTAQANLNVEFKSITNNGFGSTSTSFDWNWSEPWEVKNGESATIALTCETVSTDFAKWKTPQIYIKNADQSKELYRARMDYALADIQNTDINNNWTWYYWESEYVKSGNIDWDILNTTNVSNSKIYITVDNHNGIAWITFFWQYYTDSGRTTLIDGKNTVFVNYGRLPITSGESIYIIPASEFSAVSFIK